MSGFSINKYDKLFNAILKLDSMDKCHQFFEDVCTIKELEDMTQRLEVAKLLSLGKSYQEVSQKTGASTATISRVNKCLNYGAGGYKLVIDKEDKED